MTRQEFNAHAWRKGDKIVSYTSFGWKKIREILAVDFDKQSVLVKGVITSRRIWIFCGDFEFPKNSPKFDR
ncbi:hypothetical protein [Alistipes sp.]|uniref:hypothetical protein n=1 Tax=Alistipes sp. TaxID=1872444 RepID=UPI0035270589